MATVDSLLFQVTAPVPRLSSRRIFPEQTRSLDRGSVGWNGFVRSFSCLLFCIDLEVRMQGAIRNIRRNTCNGIRKKKKIERNIWALKAIFSGIFSPLPIIGYPVGPVGDNQKEKTTSLQIPAVGRWSKRSRNIWVTYVYVNPSGFGLSARVSDFILLLRPPHEKKQKKTKLL